jgi:hypothetical protein
MEGIMGEDNIKLTGGTFFNLGTGEKIGDLSFDLGECVLPEPTENRRLNFDPSATISFEGEINGGLLKQFVEPMPEKYDIQIQVPVQRRRHRKKRINKKWAKRYGYIMKTITTKGWKIHIDTDDNVEFIKDEIFKEEINNFKNTR